MSLEVTNTKGKILLSVAAGLGIILGWEVSLCHQHQH